MAGVAGGGAEALGGERDEDRDAVRRGQAALARAEEVLHRDDLALGVHQARERLGRRAGGVEAEPREFLGEARGAVLLLEGRVPEAALPLEVVARVEAAGPLRDDLGAVAFARVAEVGFAVDDRLAAVRGVVDGGVARDREQQQRLVEPLAAGAAHHDAAVAVGLEDVEVAEGDGERLEADARVRNDLADRVAPEADAGGEDLLAELEPLDAEPGALVGVPERGGRLEGAVVRAPALVHPRGIAVEDDSEVLRERRARLGRAIAHGGLVEELVGVGLRAVRLELLGAGAPHLRVEGAAFGRDETVGQEVAGSAFGDRGARRFAALLVFDRAVGPAGAGEVDDRRQAAAPVVGGDGPVVPAPSLPEVFVGAERLHPRVGDLAADGVEAEALEVVAVGGRLVDPGVLRRVAGTGGELFAPELVVDHRAEQIARPAVHEEVAVGRDLDRFRVFGHEQRRVELVDLREERAGRGGGQG